MTYHPTHATRWSGKTWHVTCSPVVRRGAVEAPTRSEARARIKAELGIARGGRLPTTVFLREASADSKLGAIA